MLAKICEEADEIEADLKNGKRETAAAEVGDLLFAVANLARHLDADPETTLRATNQKFERRFASIESALAARGKTPAQSARRGGQHGLDDLVPLVAREPVGRGTHRQRCDRAVVAVARPRRRC